MRSMGAGWFSKDVLTGMLFIGIGGLGLWLGSSLEPGTAAAMESGYYPRLVCLVIVVLGSLVAVAGLLRPGEKPDAWHWWPLAMVTASALIFAALLDAAGFAITLFAVALLASLAGRLLSLTRATLLACVLVLMNIALFSVALGLPLRLWPRI
jgi:hypothetical protein